MLDVERELCCLLIVFCSATQGQTLKKYTGSYRLNLLNKKIVRYCTEYATFVCIELRYFIQQECIKLIK